MNNNLPAPEFRYTITFQVFSENKALKEPVAVRSYSELTREKVIETFLKDINYLKIEKKQS